MSHEHILRHNLTVTPKDPLAKLAFESAKQDSTATPSSEPNLQVTSGETSFNETYEEAAGQPAASGHSKKPKKSHAKQPTLLSPEHQLQAIEARRQSLERPRASKELRVNVSIPDYARIVAMAEKENIFSRNFNYLIMWCLKVGLNYYEANGLTSTNPDKIDFSGSSAGQPNKSETWTAVTREMRERRAGLIHPTLGVQNKRYPTSIPGGEEMSPAPRAEDLAREEAAWQSFLKTDEEGPDGDGAAGSRARAGQRAGSH